MDLLVDGHLPQDTPHAIAVTAGFEDPDGNATTVDQVVDFKTFFFEPNFYDDTVAQPEEVGGLSYEPTSQALFVVGVHSNEFYGPRVRKIPMPGGSPQPALTVLETMPGGGGPWTYGMDRYGSQLLISMSYAGEVRAYGNLPGNALTLGTTFSTTTLPEPNADVEEVWSVARTEDGRLFFAWGDFHGGVNGSGIMQLSPNNVWSMFHDGMGLWGQANDGVMLTVGMVGGTEYLFASADGMIYKFRASDGQLQAQYEVEQDWGRDLEVDGQGRLWYGTQNGIWVFDVSDNDEIVEVARRGGIRCGRMALREQPPTIHAYCVGYREEGLISHVPIDF
jgi:hypothetical protein